MAREWDGFLEGLAREAYAKQSKQIVAVLRAKLLPLLERAEEMANAKTRPDFNEQVQLWDAARDAALKGSDAH